MKQKCFTDPLKFTKTCVLPDQIKMTLSSKGTKSINKSIKKINNDNSLTDFQRDFYKENLTTITNPKLVSINSQNIKGYSCEFDIKQNKDVLLIYNEQNTQNQINAFDLKKGSCQKIIDKKIIKANLIPKDFMN